MRLQLASIISAAAMTALLSFAPNAVMAATTPTVATPAPSPKTAKECDAEYAANKAAILASGEKKADFIKACRAGTEVIPPAAATAPAVITAPAIVKPKVTTPPPTATTAPKGANQFATEALAKAHCPAGIVVWVNLKSQVYHFSGNKDYGTTKEGAYMCETDAKAEGAHAAKNEK